LGRNFEPIWLAFPAGVLKKHASVPEASHRKQEHRPARKYGCRILNGE